MLRPVHVRGERAGVLAVVLPVVGVALVVRLLRGALAAPDDGQAAVGRVRAAPPAPATHAPAQGQTGRVDVNIGRTQIHHGDEQADAQLKYTHTHTRT